MLPDCASWEMWTGDEIEGTSDLGIKTLFVRKGTTEDIQRAAQGIGRIWFCKEFVEQGNWHVIDFLKGRVLCVEMTPMLMELQRLPEHVREVCQVYLKVPFYMKKGDFVCVGRAFEDEAFEIGKGAKVTPDQYGKDVKIK